MRISDLSSDVCSSDLQSNVFPKNGDPQALSAATKILFWRAIAEIDGTSIISNVIVPGLSRYIILVDDRKRADRLSASISGSKNSTSIPKRVNSSSANIRAGPYTESDIRTWSPLERNERNTAIIACLPDGTKIGRAHV